jgi:hypothetical protein
MEKASAAPAGLDISAFPAPELSFSEYEMSLPPPGWTRSHKRGADKRCEWLFSGIEKFPICGVWGK